MHKNTNTANSGFSHLQSMGKLNGKQGIQLTAVSYQTDMI